MRALSTSTAPSYTERSRDRELPPMKSYRSKTPPKAFTAPWLTVDDDKPVMTFPPPSEPHASSCADSVRRLSILSSLNTPNQEGAELETDTTPDLGAEGPKTARPQKIGFFRKIMNIILRRGDGAQKRKHEETENVGEVKRFAGTPAPKKRRVSSEAPTTAATTRAPDWMDTTAVSTSVEEMQDEQDSARQSEDGEAAESVDERGKGGLWSDDEEGIPEQAAGGVEEMQVEQDEGGEAHEKAHAEVEESEGSVEEEQDSRLEQDSPATRSEQGENSESEECVEESQDSQEKQSEPDSHSEPEEQSVRLEIVEESQELPSEQEPQEFQMEHSESSENESVEESQDMQVGQDAADLSSEQSGKSSVEKSQGVQDRLGSAESQGESESSEMEEGVEESQESQDQQDVDVEDESVEESQEMQEEQESASESDEPEAEESAIVDDGASSSSLPSSPQLDSSSDDEQEANHGNEQKVIVHDDISETERADLERHADAIAAALSDEEKNGTAVEAPSKGKKLGRRAAELEALQRSGTKPGLLYFHGFPNDVDSTPHECQFWMNQPLQIQLETWARKWHPDLDEDFKFTTSVEEPSSPTSRSPPSLLYIDAMKTPNEIASFGLQEPAVIHMTFEH